MNRAAHSGAWSLDHHGAGVHSSSEDDGKLIYAGLAAEYVVTFEDG